MVKGIHTVHNQEMIHDYQKELKKGDIPIYDEAIRENASWERVFENRMYYPDSDGRKRRLIDLIELFHPDFVEYIFRARKEIRSGGSFSLRSQGLAVWMIEKNYTQYVLFENILRSWLEKISIKGTLSEIQIKLHIYNFIVKCMENCFIRL